MNGEAPLKVVQRIIEYLELEPNESKTDRVDATEASFDFLGFTIRMSRGMKTGKWFANVRPADKSLNKIKARSTQLTGNNRTLIPLDAAVEIVAVLSALFEQFFFHPQVDVADHPPEFIEVVPVAVNTQVSLNWIDHFEIAQPLGVMALYRSQQSL